MEKRPEHIPLAGTAAEKFFVRQQDNISCGPACLASAARIFGVTGTGYADFRALLNPDPEIGSLNEDLAGVCATVLPYHSAGEHTYDGGVAVANIMFEGEGHYVLLLARAGCDVIYYEPFHHELVIDRIGNLDWISESGHLKKWSANLAPLPDDFPAKTFDAFKKLAATPDASALQSPPLHRRPPKGPAP